MKKFDKNEKYKLGVLKQDEDPLNNQPEFSPRKPQAKVLSGQQLSDMGCSTLQDYLTKNPHNFPTDKTVHAYQIDEGQYKYFDEGQPLPLMGNLGDDTKNIHYYNNPNNDVTIDILSKQVKSLENDKKSLEQKLEIERVKFAEKELERLNDERKFEKTIAELNTKISVFESMIDGFKEGRTLNDNGGIGEKVMNLLNGPLGNALATVIGHNEKVQGSVGKIINSIASLVPGEDDSTPESNQLTQNQQTQQTQQTQSNVLDNSVSQI